ncbi:hypothetical protein EV643_10776 [Kribbella sp. VKM Ac-2527]|uniref:Uncharacterized protein n=1 Tax=Kribbella caucasensis TaxID=2512215 RepID=A0A4R6KDW5_9ACTN|nr:hypothetical protein [Kribbella sp. VKM Ac-2527]TDO48447.1 hypothetical protein EV643_10776 [Kribbella sp. VKM Ac-2527]
MNVLLAPWRAIELVFLKLALVVLTVVEFFARLFRRRPARAPQYGPRRVTPRRVLRVFVGTLLIVVGLGALPVGAVGLWLDLTGRDSSGFIGTDLKRFSSTGHAIVTEPGALRLDGPAGVTNQLLGEIRVTGVSGTTAPLFIGIATSQNAANYLAPVEHTVIPRLDQNSPEPVSDERAGRAPAERPGPQWIWAAQASGPGLQAVHWRPRVGDWSVVVMNADGSRGVEADLAVSVSVPWLDDAAYGLLGGGTLALLIGTLLAARRPPRERRFIKYQRRLAKERRLHQETTPRGETTSR